MRGLIDLAVAETNTAFALSGVTSQLRLIHAYREPNYKEDVSNAFGAALSSIRSNTDGVLDEVHTMRNTYGADIVAMIIDSPEHCGMAYSGPERNLMFSVTAWNCATGFYSFGHAIGRNMVSLFVVVRGGSKLIKATQLIINHFFVSPQTPRIRDVTMTKEALVLVIQRINTTLDGVTPQLKTVPLWQATAQQGNVTRCPKMDALECSAFLTTNTCTTESKQAVQSIIMRGI